MMKTLPSMAIDNLSLRLPNISISPTGLAIREGANEEDYSRLDSWLDLVGGSALWWWGDYLNHLASARGIEYAEAKAASSYAPATLKQAAWVCRHVAVERRRGLPLTFGHHIEVAALSPTDQEIWLDRAEDERWTTKQLRAEIRKSKAAVQNGPEQAPEDTRAAKASASFEEFNMWYQVESANFSDAQRREWDHALEPLVDDFLARNPGHAMLRIKEAVR